jgi:carbamoyl-phosphate synthase large subunit
MRTRYAVARFDLPNPSISTEECGRALVRLLEEHPADALLTTTDGGVVLLNERRSELAAHTGVGIAAAEAVEMALSKKATVDAAESVGVPVPRSLLATTAPEAEAAANDIGLPAVLKPLAQWRPLPGGGAESVKPSYLGTLSDVQRASARLIRPGAPALVQELLLGGREIHIVFRSRSRTLLHLVLCGERYWPEFGVSAMRRTIAPPADSVRHAQTIVAAIGLEGPSLVEFRRDLEGRPRLLEINARATQGPPETAMAAGVNLPRMVLEWSRGGRVEPVTRYAVGVRVGWLAADLARLAAACSIVDASPRPRARRVIGELAGDYLLGRARPEGLDLSDPLPLLGSVGAALPLAAARLWSSLRR